MQIHIDWTSGISLEESYLPNSSEDYGIYQIYGSHPVYGKNTLLYIGRAKNQTFGARLKQHEKFWYNQDSDEVIVYTGRIGSNEPELAIKKWDDMIDLAEKLLIFTHQPACNSSNINTANAIPIETHVMNWGNRGLLMPEASAFRHFADDDTYFQSYQTLSAE